VSINVLMAGTFDRDFPRNRVLKSLLEREGIEVRVLQYELWGSDRLIHVDRSKLRLLVRLATAYARLLWGLARVERPDLVLFGYPGYFDVPMLAAVAKARRIPIVFDPFVSLFDTLVKDRGLRAPTSAAGRFSRVVDRVSCRLANLVLVDTPSHGDYFVQATGISADRVRVLWLGAQEDVFRPQPGIEPTPGLVVFHGTFIPLQGLPTIIRAAKLLEDKRIRFRIVGDGQERPAIEQLVRDLAVSNVELVGRVPREQVPREIASASLCFGIFGTSEKAGRVVPNKLFECLAVGRPVVTADTPAIRTAFSGEVEVVPPGDPEALAAKIESLLADPERLDELSSAGRARFERDYSEVALGRQLRGYIEELVGRSPTGHREAGPGR
jgi:glycosyltransferase involved in cell wall biosynthesis